MLLIVSFRKLHNRFGGTWFAPLPSLLVPFCFTVATMVIARGVCAATQSADSQVQPDIPALHDASTERSGHDAAVGAEPTSRNKCDSPGPLVRVDLVPSRKLLRAGESFVFFLHAVDADGCPVAVFPTWKIASTSVRLYVTGGGRVTVQKDSPEGVAQLLAVAGGITQRAIVEVASNERYEALLQAEPLPNASSSTQSLSTLSRQNTLQPETVLGAGDVKTHESSSYGFILLAIGIALAGIIVGAVGVTLISTYVKRRRKRRSALAARRFSERPMRPVRPALKRVIAIHSGTRAERIRQGQEVITGYPSPNYDPDEMLLCPLCGKQYPATSVYCAEDATKLVPRNYLQLSANPSSSGDNASDPAMLHGTTPGANTSGQAVSMQSEAPSHPAIVPPPLERPLNETIALGSLDMPASKPEANATLVSSPISLQESDSSSRLSSVAQGKICPTCGRQYPSHIVFCGKDGAVLVRMNEIRS